MTTQLTSLLDFVSFTHDIRAVKRSMWVKNEKQFENDSEHGYQLALVALYIIETERLVLNPFRAMGIALVHDILEVYAGDTPIFSATKRHASQSQREAEAVVKLKQVWPHIATLHELIDEYEARSSAEATFVYALDKLVPILNNYLDHGRNWQREGIDLARVVVAKVGKVDVDPTVRQYYEAIIAVLRDKPDLFTGH